MSRPGLEQSLGGRFQTGRKYGLFQVDGGQEEPQVKKLGLVWVAWEGRTGELVQNCGGL